MRDDFMGEAAGVLVEAVVALLGVANRFAAEPCRRYGVALGTVMVHILYRAVLRVHFHVGVIHVTPKAVSRLDVRFVVTNGTRDELYKRNRISVISTMHWSRGLPL